MHTVTKANKVPTSTVIESDLDATVYKLRLSVKSVFKTAFDRTGEMECLLADLGVRTIPDVEMKGDNHLTKLANKIKARDCLGCLVYIRGCSTNELFYSNNDLKSGNFKVVKQALGRLVGPGRALKEFEPEMCTLVRTISVADTIFKSVWSDTVLIVSIFRTVRKMVDRALGKYRLRDREERQR